MVEAYLSLEVLYAGNQIHLSRRAIKVTSSFKLMKALGIYKIKVDTGELYKSGLKKGQPKFKTELHYDGVRDLLD